MYYTFWVVLVGCLLQIKNPTELAVWGSGWVGRVGGGADGVGGAGVVPKVQLTFWCMKIPPALFVLLPAG